MPTPTSTTAPSRRWRARLRARATLSAGSVSGAGVGSGFGTREDRRQQAHAVPIPGGFESLRTAGRPTRPARRNGCKPRRSCRGRAVSRRVVPPVSAGRCAECLPASGRIRGRRFYQPGRRRRSPHRAPAAGRHGMQHVTGPGPFSCSDACSAASRRRRAARVLGRSVKCQWSTSGASRVSIDAMSLSAITPNTTWVRGIEAHLVEVVRERRDRMRVVRDIEHQRRLAGNDLEPPRQVDRRQPAAHRLGGDRQPLAQRLEDRQRTGRIEQLVGAAQRRIGQAAEALAPAAPVPLLLIAAGAEIAADAATGRRRPRPHGRSRCAAAPDR